MIPWKVQAAFGTKTNPAFTDPGGTRHRPCVEDMIVFAPSRNWEEALPLIGPALAARYDLEGGVHDLIITESWTIESPNSTVIFL